MHLNSYNMLPIRNAIFFSVVAVCMTMCTPKVTEQTQSSVPVKHTAPASSSDPCATFSDSKAGEDALDAHVIYRDFLRRGDFKQAIPYWKQAFAAAPGADGKRTTHFDDGITIYGHLLAQQSTLDAKQLYLDSIFYLYDRMNDCYPEIAYADGKKAFDLYYSYRDLADNKTIFSYFAKVLDKDGLETPAFVVNPFTALLVEMFTAKEIDQPTAVKYAKLVLAIAEKRAEDTKDGWPIVVGYAPAQLDVFETVKGFFDCEYYTRKYFTGFDPNSVDCDDIPLIQSQLKWGGCPENDAAYAALDKVYQQRCIVSGLTGPLARGRDALEEGRFQEAIDSYKEYVESAEDPAKRAKYNLRIAKIYYAHLKNFPRARDYARLALRDKQNYGEAYVLIGKLYASSGPLCGPGRGWDSQIVTWPAIDMFTKAKQVDSSVTSEANRLINTYSRYMPTIEDIFQRQLAVGQSFQIGCWIQETTSIRAAK